MKPEDWREGPILARDQEILVWHWGSSRQVYVDNQGNLKSGDGAGVMHADVTHWMPIVEPALVHPSVSLEELAHLRRVTERQEKDITNFENEIDDLRKQLTATGLDLIATKGKLQKVKNAVIEAFEGS